MKFTTISSYSFSAIILFTCFFKLNLSERRISGGREVEGERRYMVYFLKSNVSRQQHHDGWTCGGALISTLHILTSAACLSTFDYIYAIAGYRRYVNADLIDMDICTSKRKKKVIKTCVPKSYKISYSKAKTWANPNDIGLAIVESPYNFDDDTYMLDCSYVPGPIAVNFGTYAQIIGNDVVELGWGHTSNLRMPYHQMDHNEEFLREASTLIVNNSVCEEKFVEGLFGEKVAYPFDKFICTTGKGNVDSEGNLLDYGELVMGCAEDEEEATTDGRPTEITPEIKPETTPDTKPETTPKDKPETTPEDKPETTVETTTEPEKPDALKRLRHKLKNDDYDYRHDSNKNIDGETNDDLYGPLDAEASKSFQSKPQSEDLDLEFYYDAVDSQDFTRKSATDFLKNIMNDFKKKHTRINKDTRKRACRRVMHQILRRQSVCQNDHGSPLVTWLGKSEVVIGVAITSIYDKFSRCMQPNLFVSTAFHPWFIRCSIEQHMIDTDPELSRRCTDLSPDTEPLGIHEEVLNWDKVNL